MTGRRECLHPRVRHTHGTLTAYQQDRCRCFRCRLAQSQAWSEGRSADGVLVSSIGVQRRLQALAVQGWGVDRIAVRLGVSSRAVDGWRSGRYQMVRPETVLKVAVVYDALWDRRATDGWSARATALALARGWLPPLAWDDDSIDDPAAVPQTPSGGLVELSPCGTAAAYRRHFRRGEKPCSACSAAGLRQKRDSAARKATG